MAIVELKRDISTVVLNIIKELLYFQILFFLFVIWMAFIFMNLLVGLTVTSMDELKRTGTLIQVEKRVDDIQLIEEILPACAMPGNIMSTFDQNETNQVQIQS